MTTPAKQQHVAHQDSNLDAWADASVAPHEAGEVFYDLPNLDAWAEATVPVAEPVPHPEFVHLDELDDVYLDPQELGHGGSTPVSS